MNEESVMSVKTSTDTKQLKHARQPRAKPPNKVEEAAAQPSVLLLGALFEEKPFDVEARRNLISEAAYFRAVQRGFAPGSELDDWVAAEAEVDARLCGN